MSPLPVASRIGKNLRALRKTQGMSQADLAAEAEITQGYLGAIERGEKNLSALITLVKLADALDVTLSDMLRDPNQVVNETRTADNVNTPSLSNLAEVRSVLSQLDRRRLNPSDADEASLPLQLTLSQGEMQRLAEYAQQLDVRPESLGEILIRAVLTDVEV